ncbi:hypothetical protein BC835DRAFT_435272 [Cytidiella melzeri]|nr:hypothetical protein BC835DRAFT_435272 [Cytidiella melzeri]
MMNVYWPRDQGRNAPVIAWGIDRSLRLRRIWHNRRASSKACISIMLQAVHSEVDDQKPYIRLGSVREGAAQCELCLLFLNVQHALYLLRQPPRRRGHSFCRLLHVGHRREQRGIRDVQPRSVQRSYRGDKLAACPQRRYDPIHDISCPRYGEQPNFWLARHDDDGGRHHDNPLQPVHRSCLHRREPFAKHWLPGEPSWSVRHTRKQRYCLVCVLRHPRHRPCRWRSCRSVQRLHEPVFAVLQLHLVDFDHDRAAV